MDKHKKYERGRKSSVSIKLLYINTIYIYTIYTTYIVYICDIYSICVFIIILFVMNYYAGSPRVSSTCREPCWSAGQMQQQVTHSIVGMAAGGHSQPTCYIHMEMVYCNRDEEKTGKERERKRKGEG